MSLDELSNDIGFHHKVLLMNGKVVTNFWGNDQKFVATTITTLKKEKQSWQKSAKPIV